MTGKDRTFVSPDTGSVTKIIHTTDDEQLWGRPSTLRFICTTIYDLTDEEATDILKTLTVPGDGSYLAALHVAIRRLGIRA